MNGLSPRERLGRALGLAAAPWFAATSALRRARTFHPEGHVLRARLEPVAHGGALGVLARAVEGPALVRLSAALWRGDLEHLDVLGLALRLRASDAVEPSPASSDQDLLFATIRSPFTMLASPLFTDAHDFFDNRYWGVAPFDLPGLGRGKLRLVPEVRSRRGGRRPDNLAATIARGDAGFTLEARRTYRLRYEPIARLRLLEAVAIDQEALRFSPFRDGRGIVPRGLVHALRAAVYPASQAARPRRAW